MCIRNAVTTDVKKLPVWAYYYKVLRGRNNGAFYRFTYRKGINEIPECKQENEGSRGSRFITGGGHFFCKKADAEQWRYPREHLVKFKILRRDISHVGFTDSSKSAKTVLARRAEMIGRI